MSDAIVLALIKEFGGWFASAVSLILGIWAVTQSSRTKKDVKEQKAEVAETVVKLTAKADETKAIAEHAQSEVVATREEQRKMTDFMETDVFMRLATTPGDSGRPPLQAVTDFSDLSKEP